MSLGDSLGYLAFGNPVSQAVINTATALVKSTQNGLVRQSKEAANMVSKALPPLWRLAGKNYYFIRLAGLSGAAAVILGAIGSHKISPTPEKREQKAIFDTANQFHFFHSIALIGMPLCKRPLLTGILMSFGTLLFSGVLYYRAFTGEKTYSRFAPIGGFCLILSWLTLLL